MTKKTPKLDAINGEPIVGRFYMVPCVFCVLDGLVPIIGPLHEDKEYIGVADRHWHYDFRFIANLPCHDESTNFGRACFEERTDGSKNVVNVNSAVAIHRRKCFRVMPEYKTTYVNGTIRTPVPFLFDLERAYADTKMNTDTMICPHRGIPLKGQPIRDGCVLCCGHGLQWNVKTGELVPRVAVEHRD